MDAYLADWLEWSYRVRAEQQQNPPAFVTSLAALREERQKYRRTQLRAVSLCATMELCSTGPRLGA
jgi:hypothetical protein